jgi:signal transduction histidine kinase
LRVAPSIPERVVADPLRLRQVILNLAGNAVKFTTRGEVVVDVSLEDTDRDRLKLHFTVRDTGIGISRDKQKLIFEPFSQADGSMTRQFGGTGLGLTISARLVEAMGGELTVRSEEGKGSCFYFALWMQSGAAELLRPTEPCARA